MALSLPLLVLTLMSPGLSILVGAGKEGGLTRASRSSNAPVIQPLDVMRIMNDDDNVVVLRVGYMVHNIVLHQIEALWGNGQNKHCYNESSRNSMPWPSSSDRSTTQTLVNKSLGHVYLTLAYGSGVHSTVYILAVSTNAGRNVDRFQRLSSVVQVSLDRNEITYQQGQDVTVQLDVSEGHNVKMHFQLSDLDGERQIYHSISLEDRETHYSFVMVHREGESYEITFKTSQVALTGFVQFVAEWTDNNDFVEMKTVKILILRPEEQNGPYPPQVVYNIPEDNSLVGPAYGPYILQCGAVAGKEISDVEIQQGNELLAKETRGSDFRKETDHIIWTPMPHGTQYFYKCIIRFSNGDRVERQIRIVIR